MTLQINRRHWLASCAAMAASVGLPARAADVPRYRITDLGDLGGPTIRVWGLNDFGVATGMATRHGPDHAGVAYTAEGGRMRGLPWQGKPSVGEAINNSGTVAGQYGPGISNAWVYEQGVLRPLIQTGVYTAAHAVDINEAGQVTGDTTDNDAFIETHGSVQLIRTPAGFDYTIGLGLNNHGVVAGCYYHHLTNIGGRAFIWADGQMTTLTVPDAYSHQATDINDAGQVCGNAYRELDAKSRAFVWQDGQTRYLKNLGSHKGASSRAVAINSEGTVAGTSSRSTQQAPHQPYHAVVWHGDQPCAIEDVLDETSAGWLLYSATDINDHGQVVGQGLFNGVKRGFLATPVA